MANHGEFRIILHRLPINEVGLVGLFCRKFRGQTFGNVPQAVGCNNAIQQSIPVYIYQLVQGPMETRQQSHQLSDRFAAAGSKATPVPAEQQILVNTLCEVQKVCPIVFAQPIGSVEELEVATDSEDAACAVSIFRG